MGVVSEKSAARNGRCRFCDLGGGKVLLLGGAGHSPNSKPGWNPPMEGVREAKTEISDEMILDRVGARFASTHPCDFVALYESSR